jgi:hypothetical protein
MRGKKIEDAGRQARRGRFETTGSFGHCSIERCLIQT